MVYDAAAKTLLSPRAWKLTQESRFPRRRSRPSSAARYKTVDVLPAPSELDARPATTAADVLAAPSDHVAFMDPVRPLL